MRASWVRVPVQFAGGGDVHRQHCKAATHGRPRERSCRRATRAGAASVHRHHSPGSICLACSLR